MKKTIVTKVAILTCALFACFANAVSGQSPAQHDRFIVVFDDTATPSDIQDFINLYQSTVVWISPGPIGAYLLKVNQLPMTIYPQGGTPENLSDINEVVSSSGKKTKVKSSGLDYEVYLPWINTPDIPSITTPPLPPAYLCDPEYVMSTYSQDADWSALIGFLDTGIGANYSSSPPELNNPVDDSTLFDPFYDDYDLGHNYVDLHNLYPEDDNGHGTHVASIAASAIGSFNSPISFKSYKTHDASGLGYLSDVIYAIDEGILEGVSVFNASIGYNAPRQDPLAPTPFEVALEHCEYADIIVVAAAGNDSENNDYALYPTFPASFDSPILLSVAAMDCDYELIQESNYGTGSVDIAAPGHMIKGAHIFYNGPGGSNLVVRSGTSMAVPFVSAVAAMGMTHPSQPSATSVICAILASAQQKSGLNGFVATGGHINGAGMKYHLDIQDGCDWMVGLANSGSSTLVPTTQGVQWTVSPNPFDQELSIKLYLEHAQPASISLYDGSGRLIQREIFEMLDAGSQRFNWLADASLPSGLYLLQLQLENEVLVKKVVRR